VTVPPNPLGAAISAAANAVGGIANAPNTGVRASFFMGGIVGYGARGAKKWVSYCSSCD